MNLVEDKIRYSPLEKRILDAIPKDGRKVSTVDIVNSVYNDDNMPFRARNTILSVAKSLIEKSDANMEEWEIIRSVQGGQIPIYFWIEPRANK